MRLLERLGQLWLGRRADPGFRRCRDPIVHLASWLPSHIVDKLGTRVALSPVTLFVVYLATGYGRTLWLAGPSMPPTHSLRSTQPVMGAESPVLPKLSTGDQTETGVDFARTPAHPRAGSLTRCSGHVAVNGQYTHQARHCRRGGQRPGPRGYSHQCRRCTL